MYVNILEPGYVWEPQAKTVIYITHNGEITDEIKTTALSISKST